MAVEKTNSDDIVVNSMSLLNNFEVAHISNWFFYKKEAITKIVRLPPETFNTLQKLADCMNFDGTVFIIQVRNYYIQTKSIDVLWGKLRHACQSEING